LGAVLFNFSSTAAFAAAGSSVVEEVDLGSAGTTGIGPLSTSQFEIPDRLKFFKVVS